MVITRGVLKTPEITPPTKQILPDYSDVEPWKANFTMGTSWQYKPTNETYMTGTEIIEKLIETRAKGGNMLLNVGPTPEGEIPLEQENILREIGLWIFINGEAIYGVEPWYQPTKGIVWFTKKRNENTVFAFLTKTTWAWGDQKTIRITSLKATPDTQVSILNQNSQVLDYYPVINPQTSWQQTEGGFIIKATRAQRIYND